MTYLYRGISEGKRVWTNGAMIEAPKEKGYYDFVEFVDKNNNHIYKWEKSQYTKPEVLFGTTWYPFVDTHFDYVFPSSDVFINEFNDTPFTRNEKWKIYEYMKELYTLSHYADMMHNGCAHITEGSKTLKEEQKNNIKEYNRINDILIPNVWKELEAILI